MERSEFHGPALPARVRSAWEFFEETVRKYPDNLALASVHQPNDLFGIPSLPRDPDGQQAPYLRWTFQNLRGGVSRLVASWRASGVGPGTLIFTFLQNCAEFVLTKWAAYELGCILVPLNPRNLDNKSELRSMLQTAFLASPDGARESVVVLAATPSISQAVEELGMFSESTCKIIARESRDGWISFGNLMAVNQGKELSGDHGEQGEEQEGNEQHYMQAGTVLFTSGTTSVPKGVFHRYIGYSHHLEGMKMFPSRPGRLPPDSRCCCVLPNNHLLALYSHWNAYCWGAAWIFPGPVFQPGEMVRTLRREGITHVDLVPTMLYAILGELNHGPLEKLDSIVYAGSVVSPETMRLSTDILGARSVEALFGMTEGPVIRGGIASRGDMARASSADKDIVPVGFAGPGHSFRVADSGTNEVLPVGELGELQASGPAVAQSYLGGVGENSFYTSVEGGRRWLKTGDQAKMDGDGRIYITGRYKDMIIRGGENMSPTAIETAIRRNRKLALLDPQVVGAPDAIAGEVPVVVVKATHLSAEKRELILTTVSDSMGTMYVPANVISLQGQLLLSDYPRTMSGKIQKTKLAAVVSQYLRSVDEDIERSKPVQNGLAMNGNGAVHVENVDNEDLEAVIKDIWARATGQDVSRLPMDSPISMFADSILIMRVRGKVRMKTGKTLSMAEMTSAGTIAGQITLLKSKAKQFCGPAQDVSRSIIINDRKQAEPPTMEDMVHTAQDPNRFASTKDLVTTTLAPYGLEWNDVEALFPCSDHLNVFGRFLDPLGINTGVLAHKATKRQLRAALKRTIANNRILGSFIVDFENENKQPQKLHVVIRPSKKLFELMFEDGGSVRTSEELREQIPLYPNEIKCQRPGPLAKVVLYDIQDTGTGGAILATHHTIVDAFMVQIVCDDIEKSLAGISIVHSPTSSTLRPHVDFQLWSDSYNSLRSSPEAMNSVQWHVSQLDHLASHQDAIWPGKPPESFIQHGESESDKVAMVRLVFDAPDLCQLRSNHHLMPSTVLKTAQALLNIHRTGATHAIFSNFEACRSKFPFLPKSIAREFNNLDATDVSGPTFSTVINLLEIPQKETALDLLKRVQAHQTDLTKHAAAPAQLIVGALGGPTTTAGKLMQEIPYVQWFNWSPGVGASIGDPYENIEVLNHNPTMSSARGMGLGVRAGLGGPDGITYVIIVRTAILGKEGAQRAAADLETLSLWLLTPENWNRPVRDILAAL